MSFAAQTRPYVLRFLFIGMALVMLARLFYLQVVEDKYKIMSDDITIYRKVVYPPRGVIYDRKGRPLCYNEAVYDLMMTHAEVPKGFDSTGIIQVLGITPEDYHNRYEKAKWMNGPKRPGTFVAQLTAAQTARFQESQYDFPGFQMVERNIRSYPKPIAGVVMGYIGEVSQSMLKRDRFASYNQGDYVGVDGLESFYEEALRGQRGIHFYQKDNYNRPKDRYKGGVLDTAEVAGRSLELYLDADLQEYGEKLMANKLGSVVAIDPTTGGILAMVSSSTYDPNLLRGADRSRNYSALYQDIMKPMFNRAMKASYPPGSTQKPLTALIALDEKVITPAFGYPCFGGYNVCGKHIACTHSGGGHAANLRAALAHSCNAYFCHLYRLAAEAPQWHGPHAGLQKWYEYMYSFGFGHPLGIDLPYEISGTVFDSAAYNKMYNFPWNSCTNVFIGMGQGELTATPLQMANAMCLVANHGFYYIPHLVKSIGKNPKDSLLAPYLVKHQVTHISDADFEVVGLGMMDVVDHGTATVAKLPGIEVCAKTGTAENSKAIRGVAVKMENNSMFVAFAPRVNPRICIAVAVENAGYGATWAGPVASLMIEKYLNDSIASNRMHLQERMYSGRVVNKYLPYLDSVERAQARARDERRRQMTVGKDAASRAQQVQVARWYLDNVLINSVHAVNKPK